MLIAQISDVHVRPVGQLYQGVVDSNRMLAAAVAHLNALDPRPDVVLITGDLVDEGDPAEYAALRGILADLALPYLVIPGNHDGREACRTAFADHRYLPATGPMHYTIEAHTVRIVAFDTTVPGGHHGAADAAGLAWLDTVLGADRTRPTVVIMHHPPFLCGIPYLDKYRLMQPEALAAVIARAGNIERVLCGHVHRPIQARWAGTLICACPSTTTQIALRLRPDAAPASYLEPPACLLHHWTPDGGMITHTSYIGSFAGPYPFA
jgi:3',5'-cyclic-AMP phosphodiesterase